jgi:hypothetical protein
MTQKTVQGEWAPIFRAAKAEQRYTHAQISIGTGIPYESIVSYFRGLRNPKKAAFDKITNFLNITL